MLQEVISLLIFLTLYKKLLNNFFSSKKIYTLLPNPISPNQNHYMPPTLMNDVVITNVVYDYLLVLVTNPVLHQLTLQYIISNKDNHSIIRKGCFTGQSVQLRVAHMPEGLYNFCIGAEGGEPVIVPFEKKSEGFEQNLGRR